MIKLSLKGGDVMMILGVGYLSSSYEGENKRRRLRMGDLGWYWLLRVDWPVS